MEKFCDLELNLTWHQLLAGLAGEHFILLNKPNGDFIFAWDKMDELVLTQGEYDAKKFQFFIQKHPKKYILGYLSYDIKNNETRNLKKSPDPNPANDLHFMVPKHVVLKKNGNLLYFGSMIKKEAEAHIASLIHKTILPVNETTTVSLHENTSKQNYLNTVDQIKNRIQQGDIYELNYCVNFNSSFKHFNAYETYLKLCKNTEAPFACFLSLGSTLVLSASPERFLSKTADRLVSQPIKGTAKRGETEEQDLEVLKQLISDPKEIAENVMIVDLVRNDLSKIAKKNSVHVDELCQPYTFKTVHQLISSISCKIKPDVNHTQIIQALFPMGSMTGAPKISAIKNIQEFETFNRGIYSGSVGYIEPNGNFDYNVVIRTIVANRASQTLSCSVGGAITINADPLNEYNECRLKLKAIENTLC